MLPYSFINCALAYVMVQIVCADTLCAAVLCGFVPCLLESGVEADEEIMRDCNGLS